MRQGILVQLWVGILACLSGLLVKGEDLYRYYTWEVTYGTISPLGVPQQGILINGQFPGPTIDCVTNDNIIVNIINKLDEPFLITWNGIQQRKNSWQDGVLGTSCPIPPNTNWTYKFQAKDQIGSFTYFPSTKFHRAAGGFGGFNIASRSVIAIPYPIPVQDFTLLLGDWFKTDHKVLRRKLDLGIPLPPPDGLLINGRSNLATFVGQSGELYKLRVSNVGVETSINFRIQDHKMRLIEVEGTHTLQEVYDSIDIHVGQSVAVLVALNQKPKDYYIIATTRFTEPILNVTGVLRYAGSNVPTSGPWPDGPTYQPHWSMQQARTIRTNLTANAARPNPQGSYHYGTIKVVRTLILQNSQTKIKGKLRYAVNNVSYRDPPTPLKLADWFNIPGVFDFKTIEDTPYTAPARPAILGAAVVGTTLHDFVEIVFQNTENVVQSWHFDGNSFFVVGYGSGKWTADMRKQYNLADGISRHTVQVYPNSWSAILVSLDNKGMWNLRSAIWSKRFLGQQLYVRVWSNERSFFTEYGIPEDALLCGKAAKHS